MPRTWLGFAWMLGLAWPSCRAPWWATTWLDDANTEIAPRLGLPDLPVVAWPEVSELL